MIVFFIALMCHVLVSSKRECSGLWMSESYRQVLLRGKANEDLSARFYGRNISSSLYGQKH